MIVWARESRTAVCLFIFVYYPFSTRSFSHLSSLPTVVILFSRQHTFLRALTAKSQILNFYIDLLTEAFNNSLKMANFARPNLLRCSKCNTFRDENSFEKHRSGKTKKLCNRHGRKRKLDAVFDSWDAFEDRLVAWNRPVLLFFF